MNTQSVEYSDNLIEKLREICKDKGMRVTPQRIEIFKAVAQSKEHPDAEAVYELVKQKMPSISVDTVYRTLTSLEELNVVFRVDNQLPKARFDADKRPHHHFICTKCNEVFDIFPSEEYFIDIPDDAKKIGLINDINIQIRGICNNCRNKI